jgi:heat shock protein HslJ
VSTAPGDVAGAAVIGPDWQLRGLTGPDGTARPVTVPAHFQITGSGLTFSDGCNSGGGQATVTGSTISFAKLIHTTMACASSRPGQSQQEQLIDAVIAGSVHWAVQAGVLTLSKPGVGTLSYTAAPATPTVNSDSVFAGTWYLQTVQPGDNIAQPYGTAVSAPPGAHLIWAPGGLTGSDGCNSFRADYRYVGTAAGGSLTVTNFVTVPPAIPCPSLPSEVSQILTGATHWAMADGRLSITDAHGGVLTFTRAAAGGSAPGSQSPSTASRP